MSVGTALLLALGSAILAIVYGAVSVGWILAKPAGNDRMQEIAAAIQQGASAYLNRQYTTISMVGVVLFVVLQPGLALNDELISRIKRRVREKCSPRHVPAKIIEVADIPYTISGKKVELAVQNVVHGREVKNKDALANPEALDCYVDLPELKT